MWSRVVEIMLGCWLMMSPFIFRHADNETALWINDLACGLAVSVSGLLSYWRTTRHAHLLSVGVAVWLIAFAYWQGFGVESTAAQNHLILGLLLMMFAVIPNHAERPASRWEEPQSGPHQHGITETSTGMSR